MLFRLHTQKQVSNVLAHAFGARNVFAQALLNIEEACEKRTIRECVRLAHFQVSYAFMKEGHAMF